MDFTLKVRRWDRDMIYPATHNCFPVSTWFILLLTIVFLSPYPNIGYNLSYPSLSLSQSSYPSAFGSVESQWFKYFWFKSVPYYFSWFNLSLNKVYAFIYPIRSGVYFRLDARRGVRGEECMHAVY